MKIERLDVRQVGTDMCIAASLEDMHKMQLYIEAGIPVTLADYDGRTPLHVAASNQFESMCKILLAAGADPLAVDAFGNVPDLSWLDATPKAPKNNKQNLLINMPTIENHLSLSLTRSSTLQRKDSIASSHISIEDGVDFA